MTDVTIVERDAPARAFGEQLMVLLRDPSIPADKLKVLSEIRREVINDEAKEAYQYNFALFAAEMPPVERDGMVDLGSKGKYPFTTYEEMDKILRPLLTKHGFSLQFWSSDPERIDAVVIHGALIGHGWQREATYPVPPDTGPGRNALQARGSAQTYAKRYIADLLCNVVRKGVDNDGRGSVDAFIDAKQVKEMLKLMKDTNTDEVKFLGIMTTDVAKVEDVRVRDFSRLIVALKTKLDAQVKKALTK